MKKFEHPSIETATPEVEHFDDFATADLALRGAKRIAEEKVRQMAEKSGDTTDEQYDEDTYEDDYDYKDETYDTERTEELEREKQFELFTIPAEILEEYNLPEDLPDGVAIMGGTARSLARRLVTGDKELVRDLDLVFMSELADPDNMPDSEILDELSEKYMPDDYAYGHGIGYDDLENYFGTRDLTINQCLVTGDKLLMTRAAYDDFQENIIRPSYFEQKYAEQPTNERLFLKALLLQTVFGEFTNSYPTLEDFYLDEIDEEIDYNQGYDIHLDAFNIAVTLNKAMSRGAETTRRFVINLADWDVVDTFYVGQPMLLADALRAECPAFVFRPIDGSIDELTDYHDLYEEYEGLENFQTNDRSVREAIREYESHRNPHHKNKPNERMSGKYTKK